MKGRRTKEWRGENDTVRVTVTPMITAVSKKMRSAHVIAMSSHGYQRSTSEEGEVIARRGRRRRNDNKRREENWMVVARRIVLFRYSSLADHKCYLQRHTDVSNYVV